MRSPSVPLTGLLFALVAPIAILPVISAQAQGQNQNRGAAKPNFAQSPGAWAARDQVFAILDKQVKGGVEEPPMAMLQAPDLDTWLFRRYYSITADDTLSERQRERLLAGTIHQDLQLAEYGLANENPLAQKKALRVATIANLYASMLPEDPRLQAALYEGFLLPNVEMAPEDGWGAQPALLEGAAVANRVIGQSGRQMSLLNHLIDYQKKQGNVPGADIARIHLSEALEGREYYFRAFQELNAVTTPDLLGAKSHLETLWNKAREQRERQIAAFFAARGGAATTDGTDPNAGNTDGAGANAGANAGEALPQMPPGGFGGVAQRATRFAQNNGGRDKGEPGGEGEGEEGEPLDGESEKMKRMRLAAEAAQIAKELTKTANELSTIALAKMLDATDAQRALETAEKGGTPAPRRGARLNDGTAASATDVFTLRRTAENGAREASEAAGDAKRATIAAQVASEEAAKLALRVFIVDHDTPKEGDAAPETGEVAPATLTDTAPAAIQPIQPIQPAEAQNPDNTEIITRRISLLPFDLWL